MRTPALRERPEDILMLARHFLSIYAINAAFLVFLRRFFSAYSAFFAAHLYGERIQLFQCDAVRNKDGRHPTVEFNEQKTPTSLRLCGEFSLVAAEPRYGIGCKKLPSYVD